MSGPSRIHDRDIIQSPPRSHRLVTFANEFHIRRDLLFRKPIRVRDVTVPPNRPRRDRVKTIEPNLHKIWVPIRIACRCSPMGGDYSIKVVVNFHDERRKRNFFVRLQATDLLPSDIHRQGGSCLCKMRLNERDRGYGESPRTRSLTRTAHD